MITHHQRSIRHMLLGGAAALASLLAAGQAQAADPIKIAVIAEAQEVLEKGIWLSHHMCATLSGILKKVG